jgi:hypothetical protein
MQYRQQPRVAEQRNTVALSGLCSGVHCRASYRTLERQQRHQRKALPLNKGELPTVLAMRHATT